MPEFEPLRGAVPDVRYSLLDRHPTKPLIAMHVTWFEGCAHESAGIWHAESGKLVDAPNDAVAVCWRAHGSELLVLRSIYMRREELHRVIVTPLQSEYRHTLEARSWPDGELLGQCSISPPTGWLVRVAASPTKPLAAYRWQEQHASGIEFVDIAKWRESGLTYRGPLMLDGPVFSPDGRFVVLTAGEDGFWWSPDGEPNTPASGGATKAGIVVVGDLEKESFEESPLIVQLDPGWLPRDPEDMGESQWIPPAIFLDNYRFQVKLPTGENRVVSLPA